MTDTAGGIRREVVTLFWRERRLLLVALGSAILSPLAAMAVPFAAKTVVDEVIGAGRTQLLLPIAAAAALAVVLQAASAYGLVQAGAVMGQRVVAGLRQRLHRNALALPVSYFDGTSTGALVSRCMADADQVRILFGSGIVQLASGALTAGLAFAVLAWLDWRLTALVVAVFAIVAVCLALGFGRLHRAFRSVSELQATLAGRLTEVVSGIRIVKSAAAERREALALTRTTHQLLRVSVAAYRHVARLTGVLALAGSGMMLALLLLGSQAVVRGSMTLGELTLFVLLSGILSTPLLQAVAVSGELGRGLAALARIRDVLALPTERSADRARAPVGPVAGTVVFERVSYRYHSGPLVLQDLSFEAPAGSTTALVGPNGAGKSTVMGLLLGFDDPTAGQVLIDGRPLSSLRVAEYRRRVGTVLQRDQVVDGTVADNIRYARPAATMAEFHRAARLAHCDEFADRLPRGYDTPVGERGVRLSGGQRQRVAIARAFLADPRILLLDEATNQLDRESERLVAEALVMLCQGRTTFVVAHRLETIQRADQILVLESGAIVERGRHEDLVGRRGSYWRTGGWERHGSEVAIHVN
ncbi:MAG: ABC transporter ATP-binding protein [Gemmatimonadales bacterium]